MKKHLLNFILPIKLWLLTAILFFVSIRNYSQQIEEFSLPVNIDKVTFTAAGARGGSARTRSLDGDYHRSSGGFGVIIAAEFNIGNGVNEIPDGSRIRYVFGNYGQSDLNNDSILGVAIAAAGGGGGTAVLYQAPLSNTWILLIVAGGGGGAYTSLFADVVASASNGRNGEFGNNGTSGQNNSAGIGGIGGAGGGSGGTRAGGGGGTNTNGNGSVVCSGISYGEAGNKNGLFRGGLGGNNCYSFGGAGWGGGGSGYLAGGGGGGYSGGGGGGNNGGGGGGGSYIHPMRAAIIGNTLFSGNENGYANVSYVLDTPCTDQAITVDNTATFNSIKNVSCNGGNDGSATVKYSSTNPARTFFEWSPSISSANGAGRATVTGLAAGVYNCKISILSNTGQECTFKNVEVIIKEPNDLPAETDRILTNVTCNGLSNGRINIKIDGGTEPYSYNWSPGNPTGDGTASISGLSAGTYGCAITDANGCKTAVQHIITAPDPIDLTVNTQTNVSCFGGNNGFLKVNPATGGPANRSASYQWSRAGAPGVIIQATISQTGISISNLVADTYICLITIGSCTETKSFAVSQPVELPMPTNLQSTSAFLGQPVTLSADGCTGGVLSWYNTTSPTVVLANNMPIITSPRTTFTAKCTQNNCTSIMSNNFEVVACLRAEDISLTTLTQTGVTVNWPIAFSTGANSIMMVGSEDFMAAQVSGVSSRTITGLAAGKNYILYIAWSGCQNEIFAGTGLKTALQIPFRTRPANDPCDSPTALTSATNMFVNVGNQSMKSSSRSNGTYTANCGNNTSFAGAQDVWYNFTISSGGRAGFTIDPVNGSTGNLMGAYIMNGCDANASVLACISNNGNNSDTPFYLEYTAPAASNGRQAADQTLYLRVWEYNFFDPNFNASGDFTILSSFTAPLPVTIISFTGKATENGNLLNWKTSSETDFSHFEIERSEDAKKFEKVGEVKGGNHENYQYLDLQKNSSSERGEHFYRLKMNDLDGSFDYSKIIYVQSESKEIINVYPNPTTDYFELKGIKSIDIQSIKVFDLAGKAVLKLPNSSNKFDISQLPSSHYYINVEMKNGKTQLLKLIKQ